MPRYVLPKDSTLLYKLNVGDKFTTTLNRNKVFEITDRKGDTTYVKEVATGKTLWWEHPDTWVVKVDESATYQKKRFLDPENLVESAINKAMTKLTEGFTVQFWKADKLYNWMVDFAKKNLKNGKKHTTLQFVRANGNTLYVAWDFTKHKGLHYDIDDYTLTEFVYGLLEENDYFPVSVYDVNQETGRFEDIKESWTPEKSKKQFMSYLKEFRKDLDYRLNEIEKAIKAGKLASFGEDIQVLATNFASAMLRYNLAVENKTLTEDVIVIHHPWGEEIKDYKAGDPIPAGTKYKIFKTKDQKAIDAWIDSLYESAYYIKRNSSNNNKYFGTVAGLPVWGGKPEAFTFDDEEKAKKFMKKYDYMLDNEKVVEVVKESLSSRNHTFKPEELKVGKKVIDNGVKGTIMINHNDLYKDNKYRPEMKGSTRITVKRDDNGRSYDVDANDSGGEFILEGCKGKKKISEGYTVIFPTGSSEKLKTIADVNKFVNGVLKMIDKNAAKVQLTDATLDKWNKENDIPLVVVKESRIAKGYENLTAEERAKHLLSHPTSKYMSDLKSENITERAIRKAVKEMLGKPAKDDPQFITDVNESSDLPTYKESLKKDYLSGKITAKEIAKELYDGGYINFIPDEKKALTMIGVVNEGCGKVQESFLIVGKLPYDDLKQAYISYSDKGIDIHTPEYKKHATRFSSRQEAQKVLDLMKKEGWKTEKFEIVQEEGEAPATTTANVATPELPMKLKESYRLITPMGGSKTFKSLDDLNGWLKKEDIKLDQPLTDDNIEEWSKKNEYMLVVIKESKKDIR